ncbi:MAG: hypothetical protein A2Y33_14600 [Spirochaetes bacterium GWF1_51_8]|nr:MAG: hypothetical protein A2Y33_14600 [Spirochaetes bacterium GWF1_51_8]
MKITFPLSVLILSALISCGPSLIKQTEDAKTAVQASIVSSYTRDLKVEMHFFTNLSASKEISYLGKAIPEMLFAYMKPVEGEKAFLPFTGTTLTVSPEVEKSILANIQFFSNYVTNVASVLTQKTFRLLTNTNFFASATNFPQFLVTNDVYRSIILTNFSLKVQWMNTNVITNLVINITTNYTGTNFVNTNLNRVFKSGLFSLITNEFPALKDSFSLVPVTLVKKFVIVTNKAPSIPTNVVKAAAAVTNQAPKSDPKDKPKDVKDPKTPPKTEKADPKKDKDKKTQPAAEPKKDTAPATNTVKPAMELKKNTMYITGSYKIQSQGKGPTVIELKMKLIKVTGVTNEEIHTLVCREDELSDKIIDFLKPIRQMIMNRPTGDVILSTSPELANVYLDGSYIGKSPLYYPSVPGGTHQFAFIKDGYNMKNIQAVIMTNITNLIKTPISKLAEGGMVFIGSVPTNCMVFIDSLYVGNTPVQVSNLALGVEHRVKVQTITSNGLVPFYTVFTLKHPEEEITITAWMKDYEEVSPKSAQKAAWFAAYAGWGVTLGIVGASIYTHYQSEYYKDLYYANNVTTYLDIANEYESVNKTTYTLIIISGIISAGLTGNALYQEHVYLGFDKLSPDEVNAIISIQY